MLKQRHFVISYILNNQPESIDIQTDMENISDEKAESFVYEVLDSDQPANITDVRVFQRPIDGGQQEPTDSDRANGLERKES